MTLFIHTLLSLALAAGIYLTLKPVFPRLRKEDRVRLLLSMSLAFILFAAGGAGGRVFVKMKGSVRELAGLDFARRYEGSGYKDALRESCPYHPMIAAAREKILKKGYRTVRLEGAKDFNTRHEIQGILYPLRIDPGSPVAVVFSRGERNTPHVRIVEDRP